MKQVLVGGWSRKKRGKGRKSHESIMSPSVTKLLATQIILVLTVMMVIVVMEMMMNRDDDDGDVVSHSCLLYTSDAADE